MERELIIEGLFNSGFNNNEIKALLFHCFNYVISVRQIKRILQSLHLFRRKHFTNINLIIEMVDNELRSSNRLLGYRQMHARILSKYKVVVSRETIRSVLKFLDPEGVELRKNKRFKRRNYYSRGPNDLIHIDGYDKLKPFGICIHGAIDGFSRRILWLEVCSTNNNPFVIAYYFVNHVKSINCVPRRIRGDRGTENVNVCAIQCFCRRNHSDKFSGYSSFIYGRSVSNQRIECWWSFLRKYFTEFWLSFFKDFRDCGFFDDSKEIHIECLRYCFIPIIREQLHEVAEHWNTHRIRPSKKYDLPFGKPDVLYFCPSSYGTKDYGLNYSEEDLIAAENILVKEDAFCDCSQEFLALVELIMLENSWTNQLLNIEEATYLYLNLIQEIENI